jgi:hypothetical protein
MNTPTAELRVFEFRFPHLDTMLRLEVQGANATIFASRNSFSRRRREMFVRELAAEGFIPDSLVGIDGGSPCGIRWVIDEGIAPSSVTESDSQRFGQRLFKASALLLAVFCVIVLGGSFYGGGSATSFGHGGIHGAPMSSR